MARLIHKTKKLKEYKTRLRMFIRGFSFGVQVARISNLRNVSRLVYIYIMSCPLKMLGLIA